MNNAFLFRLPWHRGELVDDVLVAFVPDRLDVQSFVTVVENEVERGLVPDELLILARGPAAADIAKSFKDDSGLHSLKERFGRKANATTAPFDMKAEELPRERLWGTGSACSFPMEEIRRRGATKLFKDRMGFVAATPNYHFCNPSGRHTERFVRLSNILVKPNEISFLAFCLLPLLPDGLPYCYVDTASLLPLVSAVNDHWRALDPTRPQLAVDSFGSYDGLDRHAFERQSEGFVLISASSSGGLAHRIMRDEPRFGSERLIHVLFHETDPAPFPAMVDLRFDKSKNPEGLKEKARTYPGDNCDLCREGSKAIPFHGEQFNFAGPQHEPVLIKKADAPRGLSEVLARYAGKSIFRVGRHGTTKPGPRLYLVSSADLVQDTQFEARVAYAARRLVPAGLKKVVVLDDDSLGFAKQLVGASGGQVSPDFIPAKDISSLGGDEPILIAAIVIESGRSLQDISHDLRTQCKGAPQIFVVGTAKASSSDRLESIRNTLVQTDQPVRHEFAVLETLILPPSDARNAWRRELDFLKDPSLSGASKDVADWIEARRKRLESKDALLDDLFLDAQDENHIAIQTGFVFWPAETAEGNQAEVFFTVSSVLQNLRSDAAKPPQAIRSNWFQQTLLAPENFARFNDAAVQASILRAARPEELNFASHHERSKEMARIIRRILEATSKPRGAAACEMLLALATKRLRLHPEILSELLEPLTVAIPARVDFLLSWMRAHKASLS